MTTQDIPNASHLHFNHDEIDEAPIGSRKDCEKKDFLDVAALIRSIQRAEGNPDCFGKGFDRCDRLDCAWRHYCLGKNQTDDTEDTTHGKDRDLDQSV
jgi:hypothetical protein